MPTTVANLIDYLKTLPQDGITRVLEECNGDYYPTTRFTNLTLPYSIFVWEKDGQTFVDIGEK